MNQLLKILSLALMVILTTGYSAYGQDEDDNPLLEDDYTTYKEPFSLKDRTFIGGGVGFGLTEFQINFDISPFVGLRVTDRWHVATGINYSHITYKDNRVGYKGKFNLMDFRLFTRYLIINLENIGTGTKRDPGDPLGGIYGHVEYTVNMFSKKKENFQTGLEIASSQQAFYIGAGYQQNFYRGFGYFAELVYDVLYDETTSSNPWPIDIRLGLYYGF